MKISKQEMWAIVYVAAKFKQKHYREMAQEEPELYDAFGDLLYRAGARIVGRAALAEEDNVVDIMAERLKALKKSAGQHL